MRWPPCARHNGKHQDVHGQCVHHGAPVALRPGVCPDAGCRVEIMRCLDLTSGKVSVLEAGSDEPHTHAAPIRVDLDPDQLAEAIVSASRAARQERKQEIAEVHPRSPLAYPPQRTTPPMPPDDLPTDRDIPTVTVWTDDGAGS